MKNIINYYYNIIVREYKKVSKEVVDEENLAGDLIARKCHFLYLVKKEIEYSKLSQSKENYYLNTPRLCAGIDKVNRNYLDELYFRRNITREKSGVEVRLRKDYSKHDERIIKSLNSSFKSSSSSFTL